MSLQEPCLYGKIPIKMEMTPDSMYVGKKYLENMALASNTTNTYG
jgi:hypothetical protein